MDTIHCFEFDNCSYTVGRGDKAKTLISAISGSVTGGHILAIMGPSGAGKTVLMKMLTLEKVRSLDPRCDALARFSARANTRATCPRRDPAFQSARSSSTARLSLERCTKRPVRVPHAAGPALRIPHGARDPCGVSVALPLGAACLAADHRRRWPTQANGPRVMPTHSRAGNEFFAG